MAKTKSAPKPIPRKKPAQVSKRNTLDLTNAVAAVTYADNLSVEQLVQNMGSLQTTVQASLANLGAQLTTKLEESKQLDIAIDEKQRRFKELTNKEAAAITMDELNIEIENKRDEWSREQELLQQERALECDQQAAEDEQAANQAKWAHEALISRQNDIYNALVESHKRTEEARQADLDRQWKLREDQLKQQEDEVVALRKQVADFPAQQAAEIKRATEELRATLEKDHKHALELLRRDTAAEVDLQKQRLTAANEALNSAQQRAVLLQTQLIDSQQAAIELTKSVVSNTLNVKAANDRATAVQETAAAVQSKTGK